MSLTPAQVAQLHDAITGYTFPAVYFDFDIDKEIAAQTMTAVETVIATQLRANAALMVKFGLANVLYWGYAQIGYRGKRVNDFMDNVTEQHITAFQRLITADVVPALVQIKNIRLPQYSGMSFISKILMFLHPKTYCVLDKQLAKLRTPGSPKILNDLVFGENETQIRITSHNEAIYNGWRNECAAISQIYFQGTYRVVDIERGFFTLIQQNHLLDAQTIYNNA